MHRFYVCLDRPKDSTSIFIDVIFEENACLFVRAHVRSLKSGSCLYEIGTERILHRRISALSSMWVLLYTANSTKDSRRREKGTKRNDTRKKHVKMDNK